MRSFLGHKVSTVRSCSVWIYVGFAECETGVIHTLDEARDICQFYVNEVGLCVTLTMTDYVYTFGEEAGVIIGLINYPRFPSSRRVIYRHAMELANVLMTAFNQRRVTVVFPSRTIMLTNKCFE